MTIVVGKIDFCCYRWKKKSETKHTQRLKQMLNGIEMSVKGYASNWREGRKNGLEHKAWWRRTGKKRMKLCGLIKDEGENTFLVKTVSQKWKRWDTYKCLGALWWRLEKLAVNAVRNCGRVVVMEQWMRNDQNWKLRRYRNNFFYVLNTWEHQKYRYHAPKWIIISEQAIARSGNHCGLCGTVVRFPIHRLEHGESVNSRDRDTLLFYEMELFLNESLTLHRNSDAVSSQAVCT